jgi:UDP-GlcNAc:undecaprenyl-phosphate GlcNAc-1-phosphate transferase
MRYQLIGCFIALAGALAFTPMLRNWARSIGLIDLSDGERKLHIEPVPRIGGVAISLSVLLAIAVMGLLDGASPFVQSPVLAAAIAGGLAMHLLGFWDDLASIRARYKLVWQFLIATTVFIAGLRIETVALPFSGEITFSMWSSYLLTVLWLVGVTNAFNLIDGIDGLASGIACIALVAMAMFAFLIGNTGVAFSAILISAAILGFLCYNFAPASIFLGDSGSLFLGFMLASIGILAVQSPSGAIPIITPMLILGIPGLDTALAIVRRFLRGQKIFAPDHGHIHHRLLHLGYTPRQATVRLYGAAILLAMSAFIVSDMSHSPTIILIMIGGATIFAVHRLRFQEFEELGRLLRRQASRDSIRRNIGIREASSQLRGASDLPSVLAILEKTFDDNGLEAAEIRLRQSFIVARSNTGSTEPRTTEDRTLWSWSRTPHISPESWKIVWPLLDDAESCFGALTIWQTGTQASGVLPQLNVISEHLREELEQKLLRLWWSGGLPTTGRIPARLAPTATPPRRSKTSSLRTVPRSGAETVA